MKITNKRLQTWMHVHGFTEDTLPTSDISDNPVITINGERACWTWHYSYWIREQIRTFAQEGYAPFKSEFEADMTFLDKDIPIAFYFHRGDSPGEGGSGQSWDSNLLLQLLAKSAKDIGCHVLTDGEPGGLRDEVATQCQKVSLASSHLGRDYFYGVIPKA